MIRLDPSWFCFNENIEGKIIVRFYVQINFFIILIKINGGDFDKCGGDIDRVILQWGDLTCIPQQYW
jgi:hypothetical protein